MEYVDLESVQNKGKVDVCCSCWCDVGGNCRHCSKSFKDFKWSALTKGKQKVLSCGNVAIERGNYIWYHARITEAPAGKDKHSQNSIGSFSKSSSFL